MAKPFLLTTWQPLRYVEPLPDGLIKETCLMSLVRSQQSSKPSLAVDVLETPRHFGAKGIFVRNTAKAAQERAADRETDVARGLYRGYRRDQQGICEGLQLDLHQPVGTAGPLLVCPGWHQRGEPHRGSF